MSANVGRDPLLRFLKAQQLTDDEIRRILRDAARESRRIINVSGNFSGSVRAAQIELAQEQLKMWRYVGDATKVGIGDAVDASGDAMSLLTEVLMNSVGGSTAYWRHSMLTQARQGIQSLISRKENGISLSERVYKNQALSSGRIDRLVNTGLSLGKSAREIAKDVYTFIDPLTPGGASYAAMRLGRTELNNAFHATSIRLTKDMPWVTGQKWNLSGSHPKPDVCNDYASGTHFRGGDPGVFKAGDVPGKPHPQCLCYLTAVTLSEKEFDKQFHAGKFDDYIERQMGCSAVA